MSDKLELSGLSAEAQAIKARLDHLWADEGVNQLSIFLDPDIITVLDEIKQLTTDFVAKIADLSE